MIIIKVTNEKIFVNPIEFFKTGNTNLPMEHLHFRNRPGHEIYWLCQIAKANDDNAYYINIVDLKPKNAQERFSKQDSLSFDLNYYCSFTKFSWKSLEEFLTCYRKDALSAILKEEVKK